MNRRLWTMLALAAIGVLALSTPGLAATISHVGQADPTTEGWNLLQAGTQTLAGGNDGEDYWEIDGSSALSSDYVTYNVDQNDTGFTDILTDPAGWKVTARVKVVTGSDARNEPSFGVTAAEYWIFSLFGGADGLTDGLYYRKTAVGGDYGADQLLYAVDVSAYHTYEVAYDPSTGNVAVKVDGSSVGTLSPDMVKDWGNSTACAWTAVGACKTRWNHVEFGVVPEPATMALLAMGGCGVLLRRRRR